jgi:hypothetical protein
MARRPAHCKVVKFGKPMTGMNFITPRGRHVWAYRHRTETRFYDCDAKQVGPAHQYYGHAILFAHKKKWRDPDSSHDGNRHGVMHVLKGARRRSRR